MIKNRKTIRVYAFVFALMLTLLLSSMIGTTAGKKPANPGRSVKSWDIKIWIGVEGEDTVLQPYDGKDYLFAQNYPCSGGLWDPPSDKGPPRQRGWAYGALYLSKYLEGGEWVGDYCGTYEETENPPLSPLYYSDTNTAISVRIQHDITPPGAITETGQDYWTFNLDWIRWTTDSVPTIYMLTAQTDDGPGAEGMLDNEVWVILFDEADATLESYVPGPDPPSHLWDGTVSFTVEMSRTAHEP